MGTPAEHVAILHYIRSLRMMARDDKRLSNEAFNEHWREHASKERVRHIREALHWRRYERDLRGCDSASTILARAKEVERQRAHERLAAQLHASVVMEAAE